MAEKKYIERDAAHKRLMNNKKWAHDPSTMEYAAELVLTVPAADVVEVVHGEWIVTKTEHGWNCAEYPTEFTCSVCGRTEPQKEAYCHCGARMDGERKEATP